MTRAYRRDMSRRLDLTDLTRDQRMILERGDCYFDSLPIETLQDLWEQHREGLRSEWIEARPGSRPFAEWLVDLIPQHGERRLTRFATGLDRQHWLRFGILHTDLTPPAQESEASYLDRHGLLSDQEREALGGEIETAEEEFQRKYPEWFSRLSQGA